MSSSPLYRLLFQYLLYFPGKMGDIQRLLDKPMASFIHNLARLTVEAVAAA